MQAQAEKEGAVPTQMTIHPGPLPSHSAAFALPESTLIDRNSLRHLHSMSCT
jgi:hypothetical protein